MISKKILLGTGVLIATIVPITLAISCGSDKENNKPEPVKLMPYEKNTK